MILQGLDTITLWNLVLPGIQNKHQRRVVIIVHCLTRSDVTSVERGVRMSQCGQAPLGMRIEGVGDSHFS